MSTDKLRRQIEFLTEIDKMKSTFRRTMLIDLTRRENDAEHSWHFAVAAMIFEEYAAPNVDINKVIRMALVHDLVEIYAGDTFAYDISGNSSKAEREAAAADRLFSAIPDGKGDEIRALWEEFDEMKTPDSRFAAAIDRAMPFIMNTLTGGYTWVEGNVRESQVLARMAPIKDAIPPLWEYILEEIDHAVEQGWIIRE